MQIWDKYAMSFYDKMNTNSIPCFRPCFGYTRTYIMSVSLDLDTCRHTPETVESMCLAAFSSCVLVVTIDCKKRGDPYASALGCGLLVFSEITEL